MKNNIFFLVIILFSYLKIFSQTPTNGLVAFYPFNSNSIDESGHGNNGAISGAILTADRFGNANNAYSFNGLNNYISISPTNPIQLPTGNSIRTFSVWFKIINGSNGGNLFYYGDDAVSGAGTAFSIGIDTTRVHADDFFNSGILLTNFSKNQWYNLTCVYLGNDSIKIYKNSVYIGAMKMSGGILKTWTTGHISIGTRFDTYNGIQNPYKGIIDDVRIYNRILSQSEINSVYYEGNWSLQPIQYPLYDIDGNGYDTVNIGTQVWMKQNLKTTHYRNGDNIGTTTPATLNISAESSPKYQWAYNGYQSNVATYGRLYTWYVVNDSRNLCPSNWHVPSENEWTILTTYLGDGSIAGGKLKEAGLTHWTSPNTNATNENGFSALPSGGHDYNGPFVNIGSYCTWWSSTENGIGNAWHIDLYYNNGILGKYQHNKCFGFSVRCLKDITPQTNLTFPKISLSNANLIAGQNITINGTDFKPNGFANISIQGPGGFLQSFNISTNTLGKFSYLFTSTNVMLSGFYNVTVIDTVSKLTCTSQFNFNGSIIANNLDILFPTSGLSFYTNQLINIEWKDKLVLGNSYTIIGSKRYYKYTIEYSDSGGSWQNIGIVDGLDYLNSYVTLNKSFAYSSASNNIKIRITDFYNPANVQISPSFVITTALASNIHVDYNWDFSYPLSGGSFSFPQGVAADGTARIFLNVTKINPSIGLSISSVSVTLSDGYNGTDNTKLGRVMSASQKLIYSSEANGINSISASIIKTDSNYVFWYVAPDDFVGNNPQDSLKSYRNVNATFTVTYSDMTSELIIKQIKIVRPPLMFVHGLGGDKHTWDDFSNTSFGFICKFINDPRFIIIKAVNISPNSSFKVNALDMTLGNTNSNPNTFQGIVSAMRNKGYAANRVDYVCHSMGGCVLRSIFDNWGPIFTRTGSFQNSSYKNYERGYVNKVIMIDVPNHGSQWADIINRYVGDLPFLANTAIQSWYAFSGQEIPIPLVFIKPVNPNSNIWTFQSTDAVNDLQINQSQGGVKFGITNTKAHLISGDILPGNQTIDIAIPQDIINFVKNCGDESLDKFLNYLLKIGSNKEGNPVLKEILLNILKSDVSPVSKALDFLNKTAMVMDAFNTGTFLPESDLIVSIESQLAGYTRPLSNGILNVSVYDNYVGHSFIRPVLKNIDVGNRVNFLLNSSINSSLFNIIPATPTSSLSLSSKSNLQTNLNSLNSNQIISKKDTTKLQIISPQKNSTYKIDSILHIGINVKDTTNLLSLEISFQNKTYAIDTLLKGIIDLKIYVNPNILDTQKIVLEGFYNYPDSGVFVYDQINLNIVSNEQLSKFGVNPDIIYLLKNQIKYPDYYAIYQSFANNTGNFSPNISVIINDTLIVKYDLITRGFKGVSEGETYAIVSYSGLSDTIYFVVEGCMSGGFVGVSANKPTTICAGDNITLTAATSQYYKWSTGDTTQSIIVSNTGTYSLVATDTNGCASVSPFYRIVVNPVPPIPTIIAFGNSIFCQKDSVILKSDSAYSYKWTTNENTQSIVIKNSGDYKVTISDTNGCLATSVTKTIVVKPLPVPASNINGSSYYTHGQDSLTYSITPVQYASNYLWTLPLGAVGNSDSNSIIVKFDTNAVYSIISVKAQNDCGFGDSSTLTVMKIVIPPPDDSTIFNAISSNAWELNNNWNHGIPSNTTIAIIPPNKYVIVNSNNIAKCRKLTISPLGKLTINTGKDLTVSDSLILQSDVTGTASLINKGSLTTSANIMQRYIHISVPEEFHQLSSPVTSQSISAGFSPVNENFYAWSEVNGAWIPFENPAFIGLNGSNNFVPGRGYAVSYPSTTTKYFTGNLNNVLVNSFLSFTAGLYAGWNFIGNPYPSAINWNTSSGFNRNMLTDAGSGEKAYWVWNPLIGNYGCFISNAVSGTNGVSNLIASTQGFWVKAATAGTFNVNNLACEHSSQSWLKTAAIENNSIRLKVSTTENPYSDEVIINYGNQNDEKGAVKMFSLIQKAPDLYTSKFNKKWSINNLSSINNNPIIPLGFKAGVDGNYTISTVYDPSIGSLVIEDLKTGVFQNLSTNTNYIFTAQHSDMENRFLLHLSLSGVKELTAETPYIFYNNQTIKVFNPWIGKTTLIIYDIKGRFVQSYEMNKGNNNFAFTASQGVYVIKLINENQVFVKKEVVY
ncbi:MAG: FISUMP domain-containing protein [Bacteroidales bacterium]